MIAAWGVQTSWNRLPQGPIATQQGAWHQRIDDNPLTAQIPGFSHRKIRLGSTFHTVWVGSATGNGEASRRRIRTLIALQNPVAQVIVAILWGRGTFATPRQGGVMMLIGYARVSTQDQTLRLQHDALTDGGCEKLFREKLSGTRTTLPAREKLLAVARKGDVVVVWKLDRLGRSLRDLIDVVNSLQDRGVGLRSLQEAIDTTTPAGKLTFHIFAALAEFEGDMIRERTRAGLAAAHKRGVAIGRPRALTPVQILMAKAMTADPSISIRQVAEQCGIHRSTLYRHLNARQKRSA